MNKEEKRRLAYVIKCLLKVGCGDCLNEKEATALENILDEMSDELCELKDLKSDNFIYDWQNPSEELSYSRDKFI